MKIFRYLVNLLLTLDQAVNTIVLGHPDETLSSRLGRARDKERYIWVLWLRVSINLVFFWDRDHVNGRTRWHCERSIMPLEQQNFRTFDYELWSWQK